jgi:hypothetical protein
MQATFVRDLDNFQGEAKLYKLTPPLQYQPWDDEPATEVEFVAVSAVVAMFSGPETYVFPADEDGKLTDWGEMPGSFKGALDHQRAIDRLVASGGRW